MTPANKRRKKYRDRFYALRRAMGWCLECATPTPVTRFKLCLKHRRAQAARMKRISDRRKANRLKGLCIYCGVKTPIGPMGPMQACTIHRRLVSAAYHRRRRLNSSF